MPPNYSMSHATLKASHWNGITKSVVNDQPTGTVHLTVRLILVKLSFYFLLFGFALHSPLNAAIFEQDYIT